MVAPTARRRGPRLSIPRFIRPLAAACALVAALAGGASAQSIAGRVMVMIDTSGSMVWHFTDDFTAGGDGDLQSRFTDALHANKNYYPGTIDLSAQPDGPNSRPSPAK